ncbi:MAG: bis(5'-nucleosyl)-tetraphosphatase (symmetrical) YqeK [Clostridia bacterium]|nr:bis(5'-nucleosyl)-tetraphosphatase (symmetrical) YqeK [Clostridia bacterium]
MDYNKYKDILKERLNEKRYFHSLCVADEAKRLAILYGADAEKAFFAGLLHDITKNAPENEQLQMFEVFGIIADSITQKSHKLWHAVTGAAYIKNILGITDEEVLSAVRYHTTAKRGMSLLEKILYLADFTSADRDYEDVDVMRKKVDISLDDAMQYALCYTIKELADKQVAIHPDTFEAYNEIMEEK